MSDTHGDAGRLDEGEMGLVKPGAAVAQPLHAEEVTD